MSEAREFAGCSSIHLRKGAKLEWWIGKVLTGRVVCDRAFDGVREGLHVSAERGQRSTQLPVLFLLPLKRSLAAT